MSRTLIHNVRLIDANIDWPQAWLVISNGKIEDFGKGNYEEPFDNFDNIVDARWKMLLPGIIDEHVHFREPGMEEKADIASESAAAAAGGVTTFFDMPNTVPATTTLQAWNDKMNIAADKSIVNYAFFIGATPQNIDFLINADYTRIPGIKLFMGATTGTDANNDNRFLNKLFSIAPAIVAVHAEDENEISRCRDNILRLNPNPDVALHSSIRSANACIIASERIVALAQKYGKRLHIMHLSTAAELKLLQPGDIDSKLITSETCPQYLIFDNTDYDTLGSRIKCNPAIKTAADREALLKAVFNGTIDTIATDHAPHLIEHKNGNALTAASGMPGVQMSLILMLELARQHNVSPQIISRLMSANPAKIWNISQRGLIHKGFFADLVLVDNDEKSTISDQMVISRCHWTPYIGKSTHYSVHSTWVNGYRVFDRDSGVITTTSAACPITFSTSQQ